MKDTLESGATGSTSAGFFEFAGERVAVGLARRFSRRSLFGQVGRGGIAVAAGASVLALDAEPAAALTCANMGHSVKCHEMNGWNQNKCPNDSCACGYWDINGGECNQQGKCGSTRWHDCCQGCGGVAPSCNSGWPKCYYPKEYSGGCGTQGVTTIKCRKYTCEC